MELPTTLIILFYTYFWHGMTQIHLAVSDNMTLLNFCSLGLSFNNMILWVLRSLERCMNCCFQVVLHWWLHLLAQRPIALILMMINLCSYCTNDLVFNESQICDQNFSRYLASTKDLKSSFGASTCWFKRSRIKIASITQEESSSLDQGLDQV